MAEPKHNSPNKFLYPPIKGTKALDAHTFVPTEPIAIQIGMPAHPPPAALLDAMRHALAHTGAHTVYWFWVSFPGDRPHLGLAVAPVDVRVYHRVGQAIEPIWTKNCPQNPIFDILPLTDAPSSDSIRARAKLLYSAEH